VARDFTHWDARINALREAIGPADTAGQQRSPQGDPAASRAHDDALDAQFAEMNFGEFVSTADRAEKIARYRELLKVKIEQRNAAAMELLSAGSR
jgi:hypothetical protein